MISQSVKDTDKPAAIVAPKKPTSFSLSIKDPTSLGGKTLIAKATIF